MPQARREAAAKLEQNLFEKPIVRRLLEQQGEESVSEKVN
jgi:hypothetical protein